ncbi:MAG: O-acetyl-ADP-ribose deacetylase [Bacteroidota bacterium]
MPARINLIKGDITQLEVDAIVNAANKTLLGGGGVDGAIHRVAGPALLEACRKLNGCDTGDAKITEGYRLPSRFVIHTVGPVWSGGNRSEPGLLKSCYVRSLQLATDHQLKTIAFPNISTGVYGFPKAMAAEIAIDAIQSFQENPGTMEEIIFVLFDRENETLYKNLLANPLS